MKFRRQSRNEEEINLTPLIDVVFLLLIFFMVSTTFTKEGHLQLTLPEASGQPPTEAPQKIEVIISPQGGFALNGQQLINNQLDTLMAAIKKLAISDKKTPFVVTADATVPYQNVVTVMDAAGKTGFTNIQITTAQPGTAAKP
jgi:biopolymer transport protein ExbD